MGSLCKPHTWLDKLQEQRTFMRKDWTCCANSSIVNIDIDCMNPVEARRWLPFKPYDQTSNQRLVHEQLISPQNRDLLLDAASEYKEQGWKAILDRMVSGVWFESRPYENSTANMKSLSNRVRSFVLKISTTSVAESCCSHQHSTHTIHKQSLPMLALT